MELVIFLIFVYGVTRAWQDSRSAYRKSKAAYTAKAKKRFPGAPKRKRAALALRHDLGYWASQLAGGFPAARHGFAAGWHTGRAAQSGARAAREEARTRRLENQASLAERLSGYRQRQQEALRRWREAAAADSERTTEGTVPREGSAGGREGSSERPWQSTTTGTGAEDDGRTYSWGPANSPYGWPAGDDAAGAHRRAQYSSTEGEPYVVTEYPPGDPAPGTTTATYLGGEEIQPTPEQVAAWEAEAEETRRQHPGTYEDAPGDVPEDQGEPQPEGPAAGEGTTIQGEQHMAEVTYDSVLASMTAEQASADQRAAEQQQAAARAAAMADQMQALEVDPATLSAVADFLDAQDAASNAQARVQETAEAVTATLQRGHAGLNEAHQNAPVAAAAPEFYEG